MAAVARMSWDRMSLSEESIQAAECLKSWFRDLGIDVKINDDEVDDEFEVNAEIAKKISEEGQSYGGGAHSAGGFSAQALCHATIILPVERACLPREEAEQHASDVFTAPLHGRHFALGLISSLQSQHSLSTDQTHYS